VAATLNFEVRPSLAYDSAGKLWVAWEEGSELWGKDFGALKKKGNPLYAAGRTLGVKVLDPSGKWFAAPDIAPAIAGPGYDPYWFETGSKPKKPAPLGKLGRGAVAPGFPRLASDSQGRVWLAFRGRNPG